MNQPVSTLRIAMWSGPRNISTALMRSFGNRPDTHVVDEPFYACYLLRTGLDHPGRDQVLAHQPTDWHAVIRYLTGPLPPGKRIWYQKHMAHHVLDDCPLEWMFEPEFQHVFLIRQPLPMLSSLRRILGDVTIDQTGLPQQVRLFQALRQRSGQTPLVIDADDVLGNPAAALTRLCESLGIAFGPEMLHWPAGPRATDGVWAEHWYGSVNRSTGFVPPAPPPDPLPAECRSLLSECQALYAQLDSARTVA